jgi:tRNA dimethylallyltransferase
VGPTAVGKTCVAIEVAEHFKTEIVSADSRQFFTELNIGTAKPSTVDLRRVKHHFVNSHSIRDQYDAAQFANEALKKIQELFTSHQFIVVCGGSGLYIKALIEGFDDIPETDPAIRAALIQDYEEKGIEFLQLRMQEIDPDHFNKIDNQNPHRLIRALEVKIGTGNSIASFQKKERIKHDFDVLKIGLELPREILYQRIDDRMDGMISEGLFEEAEKLLPFKSHQALQTVGYQEIFSYLQGEYNKDEAIRLLKRNSRRYAKRQLTWFKRDGEIEWFSPQNIQGIIKYIYDKK